MDIVLKNMDKIAIDLYGVLVLLLITEVMICKLKLLNLVTKLILFQMNICTLTVVEKIRIKTDGSMSYYGYKTENIVVNK